ncbi:MAG: NAD(P)-dependent oxidoreductase [Burkholderiales bacterium]
MNPANPESTRLGFLGLGKMGLPMAGHLRRAGYLVHAYDPVPAARDAAAGLGCSPESSVAGAARNADIIVSSLPNDAALAAVASELGAIPLAGKVFVDTSTVSPGLSAELAVPLAEAGAAYLRATVSGNAVIAQAGTLTVMASGPRDAYERALPILGCFGRTHFYLGEGEQARVIKLVINLMVAVSAGMLAEALVLGEKGGLDWRQMLEVVGKSAVGSPLVGYKVPPLAERDYASTFSGNQMIKDLDLILGEGARAGVPLPLAAHLRQMYEAIRAQGEGDLDYIATVRLVERLAGVSA